ncbi:hypothetical protein C0993_010537, partial [Termitomyces sp. T159_Od127]
MPFELLLSSALGISAAFLFWVKNSRQKRPHLPPGPPGLPFIGHVLSVPAENQDSALYKLGKTYGDVMYLEMFGKPIIVLNSVEAAIDLLEKRSANYSDRPDFTIYDLMGWKEALTFARYGKSFQKYQRFSTSIIMQVAYGHRITSDEDPYIDLTKEASYALGIAGPPGNTPIDFFPILQYLPSWFSGTYYAGFARAQNGTIKRLFDYPFDKVKAEMAAGTAKHSFVYDTLESIGHNGLEDADELLDIKGTAATMYCAGAET